MVAVDPGPSRWDLPDPGRAPRGEDVIAVGGDLDPATLLAGYRKGLFPMRERRRWYWFSPDPRGVLPLDGFHASGSLRRSSAKFALSVDLEFASVLEHCADRSRPGAWITPRYAEAYLDLHNLGWAHSIEVWQGDYLAGGLLGVEIGGLFCGETMFHRVTDASKLAVWAAVTALRGAGDSGRVFDVQWSTPHLQSLGVVEQPREDYLASLGPATALQPVLRPIAPLPARQFLGLRAG